MIKDIKRLKFSSDKSYQVIKVNKRLKLEKSKEVTKRRPRSVLHPLRAVDGKKSSYEA